MSTKTFPKVVVVGGAGFLGTELCHRLLQSGERVRILDALRAEHSERNLAWLTRRHGGRLEFLQGDVCREADAARALEGAGLVFHLVEAEPAKDGGLSHVLAAAKTAPQLLPIIMGSTLAVHPGVGDGAVTNAGTRYEPADPVLRYAGIPERSTPREVTGDAAAQFAAEARALAAAWHHGVPAVVLRFGELLGLTRHNTLPPGWVDDVVQSALAGWPEDGVDPRDVRDLLFVDDAVKALLLARRKLGQVAGGLFHVCGGPANALSAAELLVRITSPFEHTALEAPPHPGSRWSAARAAWRVGCSDRFERATGWRPLVPASVAARRLYQAAVPAPALEHCAR